MITRQNSFDLMARFIEKTAINPKLKQNQIAKKLGCSINTLQRYRNDKKMLSRHRIQPNSHKIRQKFSNREHDLERFQLTSNDLI